MLGQNRIGTGEGGRATLESNELCFRNIVLIGVVIEGNFQFGESVFPEKIDVHK